MMFEAGVNVPIKPCSVFGESAPLWVVLLLTFLGVLGSLYVTYTYRYSRILFKEQPVVARVAPYQAPIVMTPVNITTPTPQPLATAAPVAAIEQVTKNPPKLDVSLVTVDCAPVPLAYFKRDHIAPIAEQAFKQKVGLLKDWLVGHPDVKVVLEGHTDGHGQDEINLIFSLRRAKAVEAILLKAGIAAEQVLIKAHGKTDPLPDEPLFSDKNRRVTIKTDSVTNCINPLFNGVRP